MIGILIITLIAFIISIIIVIIDDKLNIEPKLKKDIEKSLPGYNCGACGFGSCAGMSDKIIEYPLSYHSCRVLKDKTELFKVFEKYNIEVEEKETK